MKLIIISLAMLFAGCDFPNQGNITTHEGSKCRDYREKTERTYKKKRHKHRQDDRSWSYKATVTECLVCYAPLNCEWREVARKHHDQ